MVRRDNSSTCRLIHIRRLPSVSSMLSDVKNDFDEDRLRERTCSIIRRPSFENSTKFSPISPSTETNVTPIRISTMIFNQNHVEEEKVTSIDRIKTLNPDENMWVDIVGTEDKQGLNDIGHRFQIHPLVLADISTKDQRTKLDVLGDDLFLVVKLIYSDRSTSQKTHVEQMTFYLKKNLLLTFQETSKNIFDQVKKQIRMKKGRIVGSKIDYLLYVLFDTIVDNYVDVLHLANSQIEKIEEQMIKHTSRDNLEVIYDLKREMLLYRSFVYPLKEIIIKLQKEEETEIIQEGTVIYLKDLYDHVVQVTDTISAYRETLASFIDFYMMLNSNAMSEIVKTLTIISTIFIPLTFIAGVYGMNFDNMPELHWKYGYFVVLSCMVGLTLILLFCFRRKRWF